MDIYAAVISSVLWIKDGYQQSYTPAFEKCSLNACRNVSHLHAHLSALYFNHIVECRVIAEVRV